MKVKGFFVRWIAAYLRPREGRRYAARLETTSGLNRQVACQPFIGDSPGHTIGTRSSVGLLIHPADVFVVFSRDVWSVVNKEGRLTVHKSWARHKKPRLVERPVPSRQWGHLEAWAKANPRVLAVVYVKRSQKWTARRVSKDTGLPVLHISEVKDFLKSIGLEYWEGRFLEGR